MRLSPHSAWSAVGANQNETDRDGFVVVARLPLGGDRLFADRFAGDLEPLLPLGEVLGSSVGEQQQSTADGAASCLLLEEAQADTVQRRWVSSSSSPGPVVGEGRTCSGDCGEPIFR